MVMVSKIARCELGSSQHFFDSIFLSRNRHVSLNRDSSGLAPHLYRTFQSPPAVYRAVVANGSM
jgi:hypothetical protein